MSQYLSAQELAELCDCQPNQFALMARRLRQGQWPFEQFKGGCPKVLRVYHDQRLQGLAHVALPASNASEFTPNRAALKALQESRRHGRKKQAA